MLTIKDPKYDHFCDLEYSFYIEHLLEIEEWLNQNIGCRTGGSHMLESFGKYTGAVISTGLCHSLRIKFSEKKDAILFMIT